MCRDGRREHSALDALPAAFLIGFYDLDRNLLEFLPVFPLLLLINHCANLGRLTRLLSVNLIHFLTGQALQPLNLLLGLSLRQRSEVN